MATPSSISSVSQDYAQNSEQNKIRAKEGYVFSDSSILSGFSDSSILSGLNENISV